MLALATVAAVANWIAVERSSKRLEYIAKPATTLCLLVAALAIYTEQDSMRSYVILALAFCLAGDVFLMLPRDLFIPGLVSFLIGHLLFIAAFLAHEPSHSAVPTIVLAAIGLPFLLRLILPSVKRDHRALFWPVWGYSCVIGIMFATSAITGSRLAVAGALVFVASDSILAYNRFVRPLPHGHLATMVTYHTALLLLVLSVAQID